MRDERRSDLFERYRARGDVDALAELFDDLAPALLKLARHLDRSRSEAEDIVQATFLAAIERAATWDRARPLTPWFVGILMNQARAAHRRRRGSTARDTLEVVDPAAPRADAEDVEFAQALAAALAKLPPAYREVLVAHLHEGKEPRTIARELGRPDGTVRAQLHRGLRLLRRVLPASFALAFAVLLRPRALARMRTEVLERAARHAGSPPSTTARPARPSISAPLAATFVALAIVVFAWSWNAPEPAAAPAPAFELAAAQVETPPQLDGDGELPPARVRVAPPGSGTIAPEVGPYGRVEVFVFGGRSGAAVDDALVRLIPFGDERWFDHARDARTGPDGRVVFEHVEVGLVGVHVDRDAQQRAEVVRGGTTWIEAPTYEPLALSGRVVDERGAPVAEAEIAIRRDDGTLSPCASVRSAADGTFRLANVGSNASLGARARGFAASELVWLSPYARSARSAPVLRLERSTRALAGRVVDAAGAPIPGARVSAGTPRRGHVAWSSDGHALLDAPRAETRSADDGAFTLADLPAGELDVRIEGPPRANSTALAFASWNARVADTSARLEVVLTATARVQGVVRVPRGVSAMGAAITAGDGANSTRADASGAFELWLPAGAHELTAQLGEHGALARTRVTVALGETRRWDVALTPARTIRGVVFGADGAPFAHALVRCFAEREELAEVPNGLSLPGGRSQDLTLACTDERGRFALPCGASGTYTIEARRRAQWRGMAAGRAEHVPAGSSSVRLEFGARNARFAGQLVDEHADGVSGGTVVAYAGGASGIQVAQVTDADGKFELGLVAAGRYHLRWFAGDRAPVYLGEFAIGANVTRELGELRVATDASIEVRGSASYALRGPDGLWLALARAPGGTGVWRARGLAPGDYRLMRDAEDTGRDVELEPGALATVNDVSRR